MENFNLRLISNICANEESALRINILENQRNRGVAAESQVIDKVDWSHEQAKSIVDRIVADTNTTSERKSIRFAQISRGRGPRTGGRHTIYRLAKEVPIIKETLQHDVGGHKRTLGFEPSASGHILQSNKSKAHQIGSHATCYKI